MKENNQLGIPVHVLKADMTLTDLAAGGLLVREQLKQFLLVQIKGQVMMNEIFVTTMAREQQELPKMLTFGEPVWHPGVESQALTLAQRSKPSFDRVILTSQELVCQIDYPEYVLQAQVEGANFKNSLMAYLGEHTKAGFEEWAINANTVSGASDFMLMTDGLIAQTASNNYPAGGTSLDSTVLDALERTMPEEFDQQPNLKFYTNKTAYLAYKQEVAARMTGSGDAALLSRFTLTYGEYPVVKVPRFPATLNALGGSNETVVQFMNAKNWVLAFHNQVKVWTEYNGRERTWTVVLTARAAEDYQHEPMVANATEVWGS